MRRTLLLRAAALVACVVLWPIAGCSTDTGTDTLRILASWEGAEEDAFREVLDRFRAETGIAYEYQGTRSVTQVLRADVEKGRPPDIAALPNPGELARYARNGDLRPLDDALGDQLEARYDPQWLSVQQLGTGAYHAVVVKADLKSMIWYRRDQLGGSTPRTWDDLLALTGELAAGGRTPWCMGMESGTTSGWPGTDWIEDILLRRSGVDAYRKWAAGALSWNSGEVRGAWETWGQLVGEPGAVRGGASGALLTHFADSAVSTTPPGCLLEHVPSSRIGDYRRLSGPTKPIEFDFFPFPSFGDAAADRRAMVSADLAVQFTDSDAARQLMRFLASGGGQQVWPSSSAGGTFSAYRDLPEGIYRDRIGRRVADRVAGGSWCFDASDMMPTTMSEAFHRAVLDYLGDPSRLDTLLTSLDRVRDDLPPAAWLDLPCGR